MTIRRCPKCHTTSDDQYGFCIKCGYEFPKIDTTNNICPLCNYSNPEEADYCVKCGTPLIFKNQFEDSETSLNPIIIKRKVSQDAHDINAPHTNRLLILLGYVFSILGGIIGLIIAIYLATRKDPVAKRHGRIQLGIFIFYLLLISILIITGSLTLESLNQYDQMLSGNLSNITNLTLQ